MIEINGVTKKYGAKTAVEDVSFIALPGRVTSNSQDLWMGVSRDLLLTS